MKGTVTTMADKKTPTLKENFINAVDGFFRSRTIIIWIALGIVLVGFITFAILIEVNKDIENKATALAEDAQTKYSNWMNESDEKKKIVLEEEMNDLINGVIKNYPGRYAAMRASLVRARYLYAKQDWEKAARAYFDVAKQFSGSVAAPTCLVNAAVTYEENNDIEKAKEIYADLVARYKTSYEVPYALFSLGRLNEQSKNYSDATKYYTELEDKHSMSSWTLIAQNRKIFLKSIGY
jgi:tetratricopeptide (TPR) repeat protein